LAHTTIKYRDVPALPLPAEEAAPAAPSLPRHSASSVSSATAPGGLVIENVSKTFDPRRGKVLDGVSLHIEPDSFFALLGPSGCGKSTLLRLIAGLEYPDEGRILLDGEDITRLPPQARPVNTVFQNFALFPHLNVYNNIIFGLKAKKTLNAKSLATVAETIRALELSGLEKVFPDQLSGGQQQRVALARALVNQPKVLLLDEPMSHLDDYLKSKVGQDLLELQRRLKTIFVMVTHDREDSMTVSNDMAILHDGRIVQQDRPRRLFSRPNSAFVAEFMGKANIFSAKRSQADPRHAELPFMTADSGSPLPWETALVLINPDSLLLEPPADSEGLVTLTATVEQARYRGYNVELLCSLRNSFRGEPGAQAFSRLQVLTPNHAREWAPGEEVTLYLKPSELVTLESQGDRPAGAGPAPDAGNGGPAEYGTA
jgi:spermidine/putrescine transport system ATP-binding protein